jgi:hypothetical protein
MQPQNKENTPGFQLLTEEECAAVRSIPEDREVFIPYICEEIIESAQSTRRTRREFSGYAPLRDTKKTK